MDTTKSFFLFLAALNITMYAYFSYSDYTESQCKIELGRANRTVEDINKICK